MNDNLQNILLCVMLIKDVKYKIETNYNTQPHLLNSYTFILYFYYIYFITIPFQMLFFKNIMI